MPAERSPDPIVIYGAPRSGTSYLKEVLNAHPDVFISHETRVFAWLYQALETLPQEPRLVEPGYREIFVGYLRSVFPDLIRDFYRSLAPDVRCWGDKNPHYADPQNAGCLELVAELFPGSLFIHIIRDGRDVVSSLLRKRWDGGEPWVASFEGAHSTWTAHLDRAATFGRSLPPNRFFELRYEDLVTNEIAVAGEILRFLGLDLHPAVEAFCRGQQQDRTPFSAPTRDLKEAVTDSDWPRIFSREDQARSLDLIGEHLVRYGYETDASLAQLRERPT